MKHLILFILAALGGVSLAQTSGQYVLQRKNAGSGYTVKAVTPENGKVLGFDASLNPVMLTGGGSTTLAALTDVALTGLAGGDLLQYNGNAWENITVENALGVNVLAFANLGDAAGALTNDGAGVLSWAAYQPSDATLTALAGLADAAGVLANDGAGVLSYMGTSTGGNGAADSGKLVTYDAAGGLMLTAGVLSGLTLRFDGDPARSWVLKDSFMSYRTSLVASATLYFPSPPTGARAYYMPDASGTVLLGPSALNGSALTDLNASNIASGSLALARIAQGGATSNQVMSWNGTTWAPTTITTGDTPGGVASELQYRVNGTTLGAVSGSSVAAGGGITLAANGAASTPPLLLSGTWFTGGTATTTKPALHVEPAGTTSTAWATTGTGLGINAPSGFTGNLFDFQVGGSSKFKFTHSGRGKLTVNADGGAGHTIYFDLAKLTLSTAIQLNDSAYTCNSNVGDTSGVLISKNYSETTTHFVLANDGDAVAARLQLGLDHPTTATNQLVKAHDVTTGTGAALDLRGGNGSAAGGAVTISTSATTTPTTKIEARANGTVAIGAQAALSTSATDGFLYVPTCAGTPTGTPTAITGLAPIVVDTTNNKLYFFSGGAWRDAGP